MSEKYQSQFLRAQDDAFKLLVQPTQSSKLQRYSVYTDIKHEKLQPENICFYFIHVLINYQKSWQLIFLSIDILTLI